MNKIKIRTSLTFFGMVIFFGNTLAQNLSDKNYVVYIFDKDYRNGNVHSYHWIVPEDSLFSIQSLARVYFDSYVDYGTFKKCVKADTLTTMNLMVVFNSYFIRNFDDFHQRVLTKRKLIQAIHQEKIDIKVYAIPVTGQFCKCFFRDDNSQLSPLFMPVQNFSVNDFFWSTDHSKMIVHDFDNFDYSGR